MRSRRGLVGAVTTLSEVGSEGCTELEWCGVAWDVALKGRRTRQVADGIPLARHKVLEQLSCVGPRAARH